MEPEACFWHSTSSIHGNHRHGCNVPSNISAALSTGLGALMCTLSNVCVSRRVSCPFVVLFVCAYKNCSKFQKTSQHITNSNLCNMIITINQSKRRWLPHLCCGVHAHVQAYSKSKTKLLHIWCIKVPHEYLWSYGSWAIATLLS